MTPTQIRIARTDDYDPEDDIGAPRLAWPGVFQVAHATIEQRKLALSMTLSRLSKERPKNPTAEQINAIQFDPSDPKKSFQELQALMLGRNQNHEH